MKERLRELRIEKSLTQKELAKILNSSDKNIWNYEKGLAAPPYEVLIAYAEYFGVTTDYLLGLEDDFGARTAAPMHGVEGFSEEERKLIEDYRTLNFSGRKLVKQTVDTLCATSAQSEQKKNKIS